jgi:hypothetical protein
LQKSYRRTDERMDERTDGRSDIKCLSNGRKNFMDRTRFFFYTEQNEIELQFSLMFFEDGEVMYCVLSMKLFDIKN